MKKNVGTYDALMRITCGLIGIAWGTARMVHRPHRSMPFFVTMASAMKVAEGITRFCPMLAMFNRDTLDMRRTMVRSVKRAAGKAMETPMGSSIKNMTNDQDD